VRFSFSTAGCAIMASRATRLNPGPLDGTNHMSSRFPAALASFLLVGLESFALRHVLVALKPFKIMSAPSAATYEWIGTAAAAMSLALVAAMAVAIRAERAWMGPLIAVVSCSIIFFIGVALTTMVEVPPAVYNFDGYTAWGAWKDFTRLARDIVVMVSIASAIASGVLFWRRPSSPRAV